MIKRMATFGRTERLKLGEESNGGGSGGVNTSQNGTSELIGPRGCKFHSSEVALDPKKIGGFRRTPEKI